MTRASEGHSVLRGFTAWKEAWAQGGAWCMVVNLPGIFNLSCI